MVPWSFVKDFCEKSLTLVTVDSNKIHARCPICKDSKRSPKKKRFHLIYDEKKKQCGYHCFNCDASGSFYKLYAILNNLTTQEARIKLNSLGTLKEQLEPKLVAVTNNENTDDNDCSYILDYCIDENDHGYLVDNFVKQLQEFRAFRRISPEVKLYYCYIGKYEHRIIIPVFNEAGTIIYFQARATSPKQLNKYLNPPSCKHFVTNFHNLQSPVIITEGLIDSFLLGNHGTCSLGASISDEFLAKIFSISDEVIIALDNDDTGQANLHKLLTSSKFNYKLKYFTMPREYTHVKDLNELIILNPDINIFEFVLQHAVSALRVKIHISLKGS